MSNVWEETYSCTNQYRRARAIYFPTLLSSLYGIIIDHAIHAPDPVKNIVDSLNGTDKRYLKEQMELIRKLASKKHIKSQNNYH